MTQDDARPTVRKRDSLIGPVPSSPRLPKQTSSANARQMQDMSFVDAARDKAFGMANSARDWLMPTLSSWSMPISHLESLSTAMFSPLANHPMYRSESMVKAIQLAQQQQRHRTPSTLSSNPDNLVLHGTQYAWPSSAVLLQAEIPEPSANQSLFQGFAHAYPTFTRSTATSPSSSNSSSPRRNRRRKKHSLTSDAELDQLSLEQLVAQREETRNKMATVTQDMKQIEVDMESLQARMKKLKSKERQLEKTFKAIESRIAHAEDEEQGTADPDEVLIDDDDSIEHDRDDSEATDAQVGNAVNCFMTLEGHDSDITSIDFDIDTKLLVSSSLDRSVRLWQMRDGQCLGWIESGPSLVRCLEMNKQCLLTGCDDAMIKQWDLSKATNESETPEEQLGDRCYARTLGGHTDKVTALYIDGQSAVSGSDDKTLRCWDLETGQESSRMDIGWFETEDTRLSGPAYDDYVPFVGAVYSKGRALISGTSDGKIRIWDAKTGLQHRTLSGHHGPITCAQFDDQHVVSGSMDGTIQIWDLRTGRVIDRIDFPGPVMSLSFDMNKVISAYSSEHIHVYHRSTGQHASVDGHSANVEVVRVHGRVLASGGRDRVVKLWKL